MLGRLALSWAHGAQHGPRPRRSSAAVPAGSQRPARSDPHPHLRGGGRLPVGAAAARRALRRGPDDHPAGHARLALRGPDRVAAGQRRVRSRTHRAPHRSCARTSNAHSSNCRVSVDFAGFSGETLHGAISEPLMAFGQCKDMSITFVNGTDITLTVPREGHRVKNPGGIEGFNNMTLGGSITGLTPGARRTTQQTLNIKCCRDAVLEVHYSGPGDRITFRHLATSTSRTRTRR